MTRIKRMPSAAFVSGLEAALRRGDGYIMGATGQDPRSWDADSWWFTQYSGSRRAQALYWRGHAARVWDCNGLAEGLYREYAGVDINAYARSNYAAWCGEKGAGTIPVRCRLPGAAVFWGDTAAGIHHVAYLYRPVRDGHPEGDWYLIEARGVMYGVVQTRLNQRKPNYWGLMDRYFDYGDAAGATARPHLGDRLLRNGAEGEDVRELQTALIELSYGCGAWGADGDFGDATEQAVRAFQRAAGLEADGVVGPLTSAALEAALVAQRQAGTAAPTRVRIVGGSCYIRSGPDTAADILGAAAQGSELAYGGEQSETGWLRVLHAGGSGWVSGKYGRLSA